LYYISDKFLNDNPDFTAEKKNYEKSLGIITIPSSDSFQSNTQIIPLRSFALSNNLDTNLQLDNKAMFADSNSYIVNIEYPLGDAAYYLLKELFNHFLNLKSIFITGKAAIINGDIGDIQIPDSVFDEKTSNTYQFNNVFTTDFNYQNIISHIFYHQKSVSVFGTYLENVETLENYQQQGINIVEMESGPYLSAITEKYILGNNDIAPNFHYNIDNLPICFGIINYASDIPLTKTLAEESVNLRGIEPVYLASLAILQQIINREEKNHT
jgi:hypothetical protein